MKYLIILFVLALPTTIIAQQTPDSLYKISEVSILENGLKTPISKQNRNVYVINQQQISNFPARTLQEVLQFANGVDLRQRGPFGSQADISIDGGSFEQTVILLNGIKIIDAQTSHNVLNLPIPLDAIERIEVIRGPAARVYGINSLTGALNIITKVPTSPSLNIKAEIGSNFEKNELNNKAYLGKSIHLDKSFIADKHKHTIYGRYDNSNGYRYNTAFENLKLFYQGDLIINENNIINTNIGYINNDFGANGFYAPPGDKNATETVQTSIANFQSTHKLSEKLTLNPKLSYRYNDDHYKYLGPNSPSGRSRHYSTSLTSELNTILQTDYGDYSFGAEFRNEQIISTNIGKRERSNMGGFAQFRTDFGSKINVSVGTYLNYNTDYKWQIYPGIDFSYALNSKMKLLANIGTSQRIPSFTDLYLDQRPGNIGNPDVKSENAIQYELGFKYTADKLSLQTYAFHREISRFIDWTRELNNQPWQSNNIGGLITNGINTRINLNGFKSVQQDFNLSLAYTYLHSNFKDVNLVLPSKYQIATLQHQLTGLINYKVGRYALSTASRLNKRILGPAYWIHDIRISKNYKNFNLFLDANNLFNANYTEVGAIPLPGTWTSFGFRITIN